MVNTSYHPCELASLSRSSLVYMVSFTWNHACYLDTYIL
ncbi:hypothetical protein F383_39033 [Gossypium arboreum]|uniref:Uncharacterized protein n=1 Tax=Gossypium arboreum TaxID=29729 RepID=A0A0B0MIR0_GOSAR|nr:hypothetical protein F383_39033 [Gossypium arboreum]